MLTPELKAELAPRGRMRVGLNYQNFLLVLQDAPDGSPQGIAPDLARELGRRAGLEIEFVRFPKAGLLADAVRDDAWDVAFLGAEPQRAKDIAFSDAYLEIPVTFLVPPGSPIRGLTDVDREGVRIAVAEKSAYDLFLSREIRKAKLVRVAGIDESFEAFRADGLEALSGLKPKLVTDAERLPGSRILEGQATAVRQSVGTPVGRTRAAAWLRQFVEDIKASGLVERTIRKHAIRGVAVAPPA
ncbi:MAG TPA: transporter substrate-binding domain-containing protein [Burkholderiales bacterium]|nr:transporter substrate-binding domain-containing protein [Burkholderiales bacterium]